MGNTRLGMDYATMQWLPCGGSLHARKLVPKKRKKNIAIRRKRDSLMHSSPTSYRVYAFNKFINIFIEWYEWPRNKLRMTMVGTREYGRLRRLGLYTPSILIAVMCWYSNWMIGRHWFRLSCSFAGQTRTHVARSAKGARTSGVVLGKSSDIEFNKSETCDRALFSWFQVERGIIDCFSLLFIALSKRISHFSTLFCNQFLVISGLNWRSPRWASAVLPLTWAAILYSFA